MEQRTGCFSSSSATEWCFVFVRLREASKTARICGTCASQTQPRRVWMNGAKRRGLVPHMPLDDACSLALALVSFLTEAADCLDEGLLVDI